MRTSADIEKAKASLTQRQTESAIQSYPPGFIAGFRLSVDEHGQLVVGPGAANVAGRAVDKTGDYTVTGGDWATPKINGLSYGLYLDPTGAYHVDAGEPQYTNTYFAHYHPAHGTWRYLGRLFISATTGLVVLTVTGSPVDGSTAPYRGFSNLSFDTTAPTAPTLSGSVEADGTIVDLVAVTPSGAPASPSSNWVYVSSAGAVSYDATNAPAWSAAKGGWYYGDLRAVAWVRVDGSGNYLYRHWLPTQYAEEIVFEEIINIGDWNMDSTASVDVAHNLTLATIRSWFVAIRSDTGNTIRMLNAIVVATGYGDGSSLPGAVNITLSRVAGGNFDSPVFDDTSFNRGWITVRHQVL